MKRTITVAVLVAALTLLISLIYNRVPSFPAREQPRELSASSSPTVEIGGRTVRVDVADSEEERKLGLGGREKLAPDEGMLFIFPQDGRHEFWMKDMHFSIDIIWLAADGHIVDAAENVTPDTYPSSIFVPNVAARYVLELPAGFMKEYSVRLGDVVRL